MWTAEQTQKLILKQQFVLIIVMVCRPGTGENVETRLGFESLTKITGLELKKITKLNQKIPQNI